MRLLLVLFALSACRLNIDKTPARPSGASDTTSPVDSGPQVGDSGPTQNPDTAPPESTRGVGHIVVLVLDGARIDESFGDGVSSVTGTPSTSFLPTIRNELLPQGSLMTAAMNTGVTITAEGHAALLTGRHTALPNMRNDFGPGKLRPDYPTLFEVLRKSRDLQKESVLLMGNTVHLEGHLDSANPEWGQGASYGFVENPDIPGQPAGNDIDVINALKSHLTAHDTHLSVVNLHNVDRTAHYNTNRAAYAERVQVLDGPIVSFWNWLQTHERYSGNTVLVLVADHGRHRWGTENDHRHHGDQCAGCRQIPLFVVGPGIREGAVLDNPVDLTDLGVTLAHLFGEELPYAHGNLIPELLTDPPAAAPDAVDEIEMLSVGAYRLSQFQTGQGAAVRRDGVQVSDPSANRAEAPIAASTGERSVHCWRELHLSDEEIGNWPWRLQCEHQVAPDAPWQPLDGPIDIVWPFSRPSISIDADGRIWLALIDNMTGNWEAASQAVRIARWTAETGWRGTEFGEESVLYPTHPQLLHTEGGVWASYVTSDAIAELTSGDTGSPAAGTPVGLKARARHRRHIVISQINWEDDSVPEWTPLWRSYTADHFIEGVLLPAPDDAWDGWARIDRVDRPALTKIGPSIALAFSVYPTEGGTNLGLVLSGSSHSDWAEPVFADESGTVLPHISPQWFGNRLAWTRSTAGVPFVCSLRIESASPSSAECTPISAQEIDHLRLTDTGYILSAKDGDAWATIEGTW